MRLSAALLASLTLAVPAARAQQPASTLLLAPQPASCPVDLFIQQRSPTEVVRTGNRQPEPPAHRLIISVQPRLYMEPIDSIEIVVRGVGNQRQTLPLGAFPGSARPDDLQQTFHLRRIASDPTFTRSGIRIRQMNAIRWVELLSVTYTDGTVWRPAANLPCRTEPNRLLLVASGVTSSR